MASRGTTDLAPGGGAPTPAPAEPGPGPGSAAPPGEPARARSDRRWLVALLLICALGLALRVGYVLGWQQIADDELGGDAFYYHAAANLLADGEGFVHPFFWEEGIRAPGADHPPAYQVVLALPSLLGFDSVRDHQVFSCLLGTVTVGLAGVAGRQIAGRRAGLIAAGVTALYPNIWMNDAAVMSETLALLCGVVVVICAYRAWKRPDWRWFAATGAAIGLASLARAEGLMLVPLVVWPLAAWARGLDGWRVRLGRLALGTGVAALVVAPWVLYNLARFEEPATLSTQLGPTLDVANCEETYYGRALGAWSFACASDPEVPNADRSTIDKQLRDEAIEYARDHLDRLPVVVAARFGRAWALYDPFEQLKFDRFAEARPLGASRAGLAAYYVVAAGAVAGMVVLRRRGTPSFPLVAGLLNVAATVVLFYGSTRFRAPAEPSLVLLAAVAADAALARRWPGRAEGARASEPVDGAEPSSADGAAAPDGPPAGGPTSPVAGPAPGPAAP
ncbi:MAG TPA: glycosyltransferase family 39 protein [Acidimicrobiales bacterium]